MSEAVEGADARRGSFGAACALTGPRGLLLAAVGAAALLWGCDAPRTGAADAAAGDVQRGRELLSRYHCGTCHIIPGVASARGRIATTLASFGLRSYIAGRVPNTPEHLIRWIMDPASVIPEATMPSMGVSAPDAVDMAAYLVELK